MAIATYWMRSLLLGAVALNGIARVDAASSLNSIGADGISTGEEYSDVLVQEDNDFDWASIEPATHLDYTQCYGNFQCARLDVPMNYNRTDGKGSRVAVAVIKYPARVDVTDPRYGGAILINPGGPGGSGIMFLRGRGQQIRTIVDATSDNVDISDPDAFNSQEKYFDLISWDPRGVANTMPALSCFPNTQEKLKWDHLTKHLPFPTTDDLAGTFDLQLAWWSAFARGCSERQHASEDEDILIENIGTTNVVGDMVQILEAHGEWRDKEANRLISVQPLDQTQSPIGDELDSYDAVLRRTAWQQGKENLLYWGFSYGSIIGETFAALQPHRVFKVIVDGTGDLNDYYDYMLTRHTIGRTDLALEGFFELCAQAGSSKCPFNAKNATIDELKYDYDEIIDDLTKRPLPVVPSIENEMFAILTANDLRMIVFQALYSPLMAWDELAIILNDLRSRNGTLLLQAKARKQPPTAWCPSGNCATTNSSAPGCQPQWTSDDLGVAVICSDANPAVAPVNKTIEEARDWVLETWEYGRNQSKLIGNLQPEMAMGCVGWTAKTNWPFTVPERVTTAHPLFIIGTTWDPVSPWENAYLNEKRFIGSSILEQRSYGHCSISSPSLCTAKIVRHYFQTGELPEAGTVCQPNEIPFLGSIEESDFSIAGLSKAESLEDKRLLAAMADLGSVVPRFARF